MATQTEDAALLLIDMQQGLSEEAYYGGKRNNPNAEQNALQVLAQWRQQGLPVIHVFHDSVEEASPLKPGKPGNQPIEGFAPKAGEPTFRKNVNSGFIGTGLEDYLRQEGIEKLVIAGLTTNHCVSTTTRMAGNLGFKVRLVGDATATFPRTSPDGQYFDAEVIHQTALASLHGEFAQVINTQDVLKAAQ